MNEAIEELIWEHFDQPKDLFLAKKIQGYINSDMTVKSRYDEIKRIHEGLSSLPLTPMDKKFEIKMTESILLEFNKKDKFSSKWVLFCLFAICLSVAVVSLASIQSSDFQINNWFSNWSTPSLFSMDTFKNIGLVDFQLNWTVYLVLIIPVIVGVMDWLIINYEKWNRLIMKRSNLLM